MKQLSATGKVQIIQVKVATGSAILAVLLAAIALTLVGCAYPDNYQEWKWRQYNPEWKSLPGGPDR